MKQHVTIAVSVGKEDHGATRKWSTQCRSGVPRSSPDGQRGQAVLEYLLIAAVLAVITLLAFANFDGIVRDGLEDVFDAASRNMAH